MNVLLPLLVVAIGPDVPIEVRYPEAATIFHGTFDPSWDENFDGWPDHWKRRRGPGFPHYVSIKIDEDHSRQGERCLRIDLDGGAAAAYSPPIKVGPLFSYVLEGSLKTEGLRHDWAYFSITLLDAQQHRLEAFHCEKVRHCGDWKKLRLGPISPASDDARFAVIGLHVEPEGSQEDLHGAVFFDDVWLGRLPRMTLNSNHPYNFFTTSDEIEVECTVSGFTTKDPEITYQLEDESGNPLARLRRPLAVKTAVAEDQLSLETFSDEPADLIGEAGWKPPISGPGFYRIWATMKGQALVHRQGLNLVVIDPRHGSSGGEFGWTLPRGNRPLPLPLLTQLVGQAGIHWVKYPLWCEDQGNEDQGNEDQGNKDQGNEDQGNEESAEDLMAFYERLDAQGIELIGLLHEPPRSVRTRCGPSPPQSAADLFTRDPSVWYPSLEPVMVRLGGRVRWWQLGHDQDTSFVAQPNLTAKIAQVKNELDRIGLDVNLGIGWDWIHELPQAADGEVPWRSVTLSADPPMTPRELAGYLDASRETGLQRWVAVEPLPRGVYSFEVRAIDLVRRMIAAKIHGADAIFCPQPFSTDRGLMNDDGTPGEIFLPWRTVAVLLGGARYLGSVQLPGGSPNQVFARTDDAVMVVWNDEPTEEVMYLGENVRQIDLWGRSVTPAVQEHRQVIRVGGLPTLVTGVHEPIARWRMDCAFARERIPSIFGQPHQNSFTLKNHFPGGAEGHAELVMPKTWTVPSKRAEFRLAEGEQLRHPLEITLPPNASSGGHKVRIDFEVQADQLYRFSAYREIDVGLGDVYIDVVTQLNNEGELEVHQRFVNETDTRVSFHCQLFAPDRRRLKTQVVGLDHDQDVQVYRLSRGEELVGRTLWLRAEETDGPRILNYRFVARQ